MLLTAASELCRRLPSIRNEEFQKRADHVSYRPLELAELLPGHHSARWPGGGRLFWSALGFGRLLGLARLKTGIDAYLYELGATQVFTLSR